MAPSFKTAAAFAALHLAASASAATVFHEFNITWVTANPDGAFERPVIGINGQWPIPRIEVDRGDRLVVKVNNHLGDQPTSLHFHGLFQQGTNHMDGPSGVTQCPIPPGSSMTYNFTVDQPGTYWYHSHTNAQYPDGLRGPFIVNDRRSPYRGQYDEERVLTLSDWYHDSMQTLIPQFLYKGNPTGAEPLPKAALINETQNMKIHVEPGKTYMFRVINIGAFSSHYLWIEGHTMQIIEVDGVYTKPATADMLYLSAAQRVSFLLTTRNDTTANFPIVASMDKALFDNPPDDIENNCTSWLSYDSKKNYPDPAPMHEFDAFDDMTLEPYDGMKLLPEPDRVVQLDVKMDNLGDGANYAFFNDITYVSPKVPTLYTVLSSGNQATNPAVYGDYTHSLVLEKDEIVQIIVNNLDPGRHPFHLHGHEFQSIYRSEEEGGTFNPENVTKDTFSKVPMRRDTLVVWPNGNIVLRFRASNPGVWLFHCHIEWHVVSGLLATFIEAPLEIQKKIKIPQDHLDNCKAAGVPTKGNAAGNTVNLLDLTGQPAPPRPLPAGFTARGIVAFVFSFIIGLLGVAVVVWYGLSEPVKSRDDEPSAGQDGNRRSGEAARDDAGVGQSTQAAEASEVR